MITDKQSTLGTAQAVTASAGTTNYYDAGSARSIGSSKDLFMLFTVTENADAVGAATVQFGIQCDDNTSFSSPKQAALTAAIGKAALVVGKQIAIPIPPDCDERYIRGNFVVDTGPLTAGKFTTQIIEGHHQWKAYPDAL